MAQDLSAHQVGNVFAEAVERAAPGVVAVLGRKRLPGTGTVWDTGDGGTVVVTASHVVEREEQIAIRLADETEVPATLLGRDLSRDLAVLRAESEGLSPVAVADAEARVGTLAMALGRPFVTSIQASFGAVVFVGSFRYRKHRTNRMIHADPTLYPGFSGGPLINAAGEVLGINTSGARQTGSVTIPAAQVNHVVRDIVEIGYVRAAWIGVTVQQVDLPPHVRQAHPDQETAVLIMSVEEGTPAAEASLYVGDMLVSLDDQTLEDVTDLQHILSYEQIGKPLGYVAWRGDSQHQGSITPVARPEQPCP